MPLSDVLGRVPFLAGYEGQRDINQRRSMGELQQAQTLMQLLGAMEQQKAKQQALARQEQYRQALAAAGNDPEAQVAVARQFGDPKDVMHFAGASIDRRAAMERQMVEARQRAEERRQEIEQRAAEQRTSRAEQDRRALEGRKETIQLAASLRPPREEPAPVAVQGENGPVYVPRSQAIGKTPYSPSIAGAATFEPQTLRFVAQQYLAGDRQAIQGFARNATARIALQNAIVEEATKRGMTPEQTAAQIADFAGTMAGSRTVGQRAANISLAATEAQEMLGIVKETSDKFARTNFVPWNMALKAYESGTGSPEIAQFGAAVNALVNVYARAINPTGVPTVSDKEHARAVLNTVQSPAQVDAVLQIINRELEIAKKAPRAVQEATRERITKDKPETKPPEGSWRVIR